MSHFPNDERRPCENSPGLATVLVRCPLSGCWLTCSQFLCIYLSDTSAAYKNCYNFLRVGQRQHWHQTRLFDLDKVAGEPNEGHSQTKPLEVQSRFRRGAKGQMGRNRLVTWALTLKPSDYRHYSHLTSCDELFA